MEVNIDQNDLDTFHKRVFCSNNRNDSLLDSLTVSFRTFASIIDLNHCILGQLSTEPGASRRAWSQLNIADTDKQNVSRQFSDKNYCNCDLRVFFENTRVNLTGVPFDECPLMADYWRYNTSSDSGRPCFNHTFIDTCSHQVNYKCHYVPVTKPTRPTTSPVDYGVYLESSARSSVREARVLSGFFSVSVLGAVWALGH
jgi:hypothetical protein